MTNPNERHSRHLGQQSSTQNGGTGPEETKVGNNSMEAPNGSKTEERRGEDFSEKDKERKGGDPDNPSETTGGSESGGEDKGAKM